MSLQEHRIFKIYPIHDNWLSIELGNRNNGEIISLENDSIHHNNDESLPFREGDTIYVWQPSALTGAVFTRDKKLVYFNRGELPSIEEYLFKILDNLD